MATVTIRLEGGIRDELEELARTSGVTLSELLRNQIDTLLGRDVQMRKRSDVPHSLSMQQRRILAQQHEILALLHADSEDVTQHHSDMAEVLHEGYAGEYDSVFAAVQPELSRTDCSLVWDILDMFRVLGTSLELISETDRESLGSDAEHRLRFAGFDLNDSMEGQLLSYVRYLIRTDRWTEAKESLRAVGDNGNSHHQRLPNYERMLAEFEPIMDARKADRGFSRDAWLLNVDELRQVADAWAWPEREQRGADD